MWYIYLRVLSLCIILRNVYCFALQRTALISASYHHHHLHYHSTPLYSSHIDDEFHWDPNSAPKLNFDEDYYSILEVTPHIDQASLKKAYYKMVFKYHPDNKNSDDAKKLCNKQMMVINAAYRVLKDINNRTAYDRMRNLGLYGGKAGIKSRNPSSSSSSSSSSPSSSSTTAESHTAKSSSYTEETSYDTSGYGTTSSRFKGSSSSSSTSNRSKFVDNSDYDEISEYLRRIQREQQEQQQRKSYYTTSTRDIPSDKNYHGSGDSIEGLQSQLKNLRSIRDRKELLIRLDSRDWGLVTSAIEIEKRCSDLEQVRTLNDQIFELEAIIDDTMRQNRRTSSRWSLDDDNSGYYADSDNSRTGTTTSSGSSSSGDVFWDNFDFDNNLANNDLDTWRKSYQNRRRRR